jgi:hypothetical protein
MSWLGWLFAAWRGAIVVILVAWARLGGLSRMRDEDHGLRILEPTRRWDEWVNEALAVADDRPPPSRRLR